MPARLSAAAGVVVLARMQQQDMVVAVVAELQMLVVAVVAAVQMPVVEVVAAVQMLAEVVQLPAPGEVAVLLEKMAQKKLVAAVQHPLVL